MNTSDTTTENSFTYISEWADNHAKMVKFLYQEYWQKIKPTVNKHEDYVYIILKWKMFMAPPKILILMAVASHNITLLISLEDNIHGSKVSHCLVNYVNLVTSIWSHENNLIWLGRYLNLEAKCSEIFWFTVIMCTTGGGVL